MFHIYKHNGLHVLETPTVDLSLPWCLFSLTASKEVAGTTAATSITCEDIILDARCLQSEKHTPFLRFQPSLVLT